MHNASLWPVHRPLLDMLSVSSVLRTHRDFAGKAAVAGLILPVAVGIEIVAVPGAGW